MSNKKLLKNLLATASIVAALAGGASNAAAAAVTLTANANTADNNANGVPAGGLANGRTVNSGGFNLTFGKNNTDILLNNTVKASDFIIGDGFTVTFTDIAGNASTFAVGEDSEMTLITGHDFAGVGNVTLNGGNNWATLNVGNDITLGGDITSNKGKINLGNDASIAKLIVTGNSEVAVGGGTSSVGDVELTAGVLTAANGGTFKSLEFDGGNFTAAAAAITLTNGITVKNDGALILAFDGNKLGDITVDTAAKTLVVNTANKTHAITAIKFNADGGVTINGNGSTLGAVTTSVGGTGTLTLNGTLVSIDAIGEENKSLKALALQGAKTYAINKNIYAKTISADNNGTALELANNVTLHGDLVTAGNDVGVIRILNGSTNTVNGNMGAAAANKAWGVIQFAGSGTLKVNGASVYLKTLTIAGVGSKDVLEFTEAKNPVTFSLTDATAVNTKNLSISFATAGKIDLNTAGGLGDAANPVELISANKSAELAFGNSVYVKTLDAKNVTLSNVADSTYLFGSVTKGVTITLKRDTTFAAGTDLTDFGSIDIANKTAIFNGVNLMAGEIISNNGSLTFGAGDSTYNTIQRGNFVTVTASSGANKAFTLASDITATNFDIGDASKAIIQAKLTAIVSGNAAGTSVLQLSKNSSIVGNVNMAAGGNNTGAISVDESVSTTIQGTLAQANVTLGGKGAALEVTGNVANTVAFTTNADNTDSITFGGDYTTRNNTNIGAQNAMFKSITIKNNSTLTLAGNSAAYVTSILNDGDNKGIVALGARANDPIYNIGTAKSKFYSVTLNAASKLRGDIYSTDLVRGANNITIEDGKSVIVGTSTGAGNVVFEGNGAFAGKFGVAGTEVVLFNLSADENSVVKARGEVFANAFTQGKGALELTGNLSVTGPATFADGSSINTGDNKLTYSQVTLDANKTTNVTVTLSDDKTGSVIAGNATVAANAKMAVKIVDNRSLANIRKSGATTVIQITANGANNANNAETVLNAATIASSGRFTAAEDKFAVSKNATTHVVNAGVGSKVDIHVSEDMKKLAAKANVSSLASAFDNSKGELDNVLDSLRLLDDKEYVNALERLADNSASASNVAISVMSSGMIQISSRTSAVASGDSAVQVGAWVEGLVGKGEQKMRKSDAGFKSNTSGVTVGVDTELNDASIIGIAGTFANTDVKMQDYLAGDKSKLSSYMLSLYGSYNFADNYVLQGSGSFGNNTIKNTNKRITNTGSVNAKSKFDGTAFGVKALVGYDYKLGAIGSVMPMAGLEYARFDAGNATETGAGVQNRSIKVKATDKLTAILGGKVAANIDLGDYSVTPELHVFGGYDFKSTKAKSSIKFVDTTSNIQLSGVKAARTSFNVGGSITAKYDNMEYGVGYDAKISEKYFGQQGSLKVRVNF